MVTQSNRRERGERGGGEDSGDCASPPPPSLPFDRRHLLLCSTAGEFNISPQTSEKGREEVHEEVSFCSISLNVLNQSSINQYLCKLSAAIYLGHEIVCE